MKSFLIYLFLFIVLCTYANAQQQSRMAFITGKLEDSDKNPVPFANVALYHTKDSTLVGGAVSDETGNFKIQSSAGHYLLKITFLTLNEKIVPDVRLAGKDINLGVIIMTSNAKVLSEVVVKGEKSQMELQLDKRVFNVGKDMSNIGSNASDILNNMPSVTVDVDGNVALRGSGNVRILIDGKQSGMVGMNPAEALKQIPGDLIESIEIITNPSSRYDAEGEVGILNIVMKKNIRYGLNGSFTGTAGYPSNFGGSFNVNYRKKKLNLIASYGHLYREGPGRGTSRQVYNSTDTSFIYEQKNTRTRSGFSNSFMVGMDYFLDKYNTLNGTVSYRKSRNKNTSLLEYRDFDLNNNLTRTVIRSEQETEPRANFEAAINYNKTFEKKGKSLSVVGKYILSDEIESALFNESSQTEVGSLVQRSFNTEDEKNILFQVDYIQPFGKNGQIETGLKSSIRLLDNDFSVHQQNQAMNWVILPDFDNRFAYDEKIHAAYLMASNQLGKIFIQAGLRGEYSDILTELKKTNVVNHRKYFNLFPSLHLSYKLKESQTLQLSYSYRLSRPEFRSLLPFSNFSDSRVFRAGNPLLNPEYTHSFEAGHLMNMEKGSLLSSVYYRHRLGVVENITSVDSAGFTTVTPINLSTGDSYGFEFNLTYDPFEWWKWTANANIFRAVNQGVYNDKILRSDTYTWTSRLSSRLTLLKNIDFQSSLNYRAPRKTTQGKELSQYSIDLGLSRDLLKGRATVTASVRDLFNSRKRRSIVENAGYYSQSEFQWRARQFLVTFSYRLNRSKEKEKRADDSDNGEDS
ncbi:Outer membrane receptor proteins, mostly Fe transport [Dyadobacter koreensis]|uniref:Outer membrane receptor proteins, mostly Fe transport n=1 Tax=Dyadobacter koreensis TaxID=408657 RepID=A0A1H6QE56_9BACT|nr:outer membrane beta-barrel family protein [Dyadobacter koreensis]SEI37790.1 Outer membrane receptor proteins, mostly Fe transport [Dyadobacter koreensis]